MILYIVRINEMKEKLFICLDTMKKLENKRIGCVSLLGWFVGRIERTIVLRLYSNREIKVLDFEDNLL